MEQDLYLIIFGTKEKNYNFDYFWLKLIGYCYKYTHATYDWFCSLVTHGLDWD